jgi:hypothetical protein
VEIADHGRTLVMHLAVGEGGDCGASLHVPEPHVAVVAAAEELRAVVAHVDGANGLGVAHVGAQQLAVPHGVPDHALAVHRPRQQQVARVREQLDGLHALRVTQVLVHALLRDEGLVLGQVRVGGRVDVRLRVGGAHASRRDHPRPAHAHIHPYT